MNKKLNLLWFVLVLTIFYSIDSYALSENGRDDNPIGYEYLDNGEVLHLWNIFEDYYFDISDDCYAQITNHYDEYWSRNIFGFGIEVYNLWYYYESDKFCNWNFEIETDNANYVRFELTEQMKIYPSSKIGLYITNELTNQDPRLSMEFGMNHLGGYDITNSRFRWHIDNIQINMTEEDNFIWINGEDYDLSDELDLEFPNLPYGYFKIYENDSGEFISMNWESANYNDVVEVKSWQSSSYNSPVSLIAELGEIGYGETKTFSAQWIDKSRECSPPFVVHFNNPPSGSNYSINDTFDMQGHWHDAGNNPFSACMFSHAWMGTVQINGTGTEWLINNIAGYGVIQNGLNDAGMPYMYGSSYENFPHTIHNPNPFMGANLSCYEVGTHKLRYKVFHSLYGWMSAFKNVECLGEEPVTSEHWWFVAIIFSLISCILILFLALKDNKMFRVPIYFGALLLAITTIQLIIIGLNVFSDYDLVKIDSIFNHLLTVLLPFYPFILILFCIFFISELIKNLNKF